MRSRTIYFVILLLITTTLKAKTNDFGLWTSVGAEKKLGKWNFEGEAELRTKENATAIDRLGIGLTAGYQLLKPITIGAGYDFIYFNDTKYLDYQPRHRANLFITGKQKLGGFTFSLRERVQLTAKDVSDRIKESGKIDNYKVNPEYMWRNKLKVEYNIPKFPVTPAFSAESFFTLNNPDGNSFKQIRYTLSLDYKLSKHHKFEIYGMYDDEISSEDPVQNFVLGIGYKFCF
jgi:hypothetical protein